ncbi:MAG: transmembrane 220 family protein [Flavobacteriales bacterium]|nr:transmembrane 220 family protein [Flavobacteriales bacterium]HPF90755.1 transmembrane 220 family protein [Flavobacteriales bacterium]
MPRAIKLFLVGVFVAFAAMNLNDPDPIPWILAYLAVAMLYGLSAFGRADRRVSGWFAVALAVWMLTMAPGVISWVRAGMPSIAATMQAEEPHIEVMREFLGLLIAVLALVALTWRTPKDARLS